MDWKTKIRTIFFIIILFVFFGVARKSWAVVYFEFDGESDYQYMGLANAHPGGGYFSYMGGNVFRLDSLDSCAGDTANYHYTILSSDLAGQSATSGSQYSLKTPYLGSCPNESFTRDTTIVSVLDSSELYVRWYQKWTGDWMSGSVQQKFTKFYNPNTPNSLAGHLSFASDSKVWRNFMPNLEGHFDKDGVTRYDGNIWINASDTGGNYTGVNRSYDDDPDTSNFEFEPNYWYCLEIHFRINSDPAISDAIFEAWVDGVKVMGVYDFKYYNLPEAYFTVNTLEFQHVYYNRTATDQPTYMDNIVVADEYIGPVNNQADTAAPATPSGLNVL